MIHSAVLKGHNATSLRLVATRMVKEAVQQVVEFPVKIFVQTVMHLRLLTRKQNTTAALTGIVRNVVVLGALLVDKHVLELTRIAKRVIII